MTPKPCTRCRGDTEVTLLDHVTGDSSPLSLALKAMPVAACARGHRQFLDREFPRRLIDHLMREAETKLPAGTAKGMFVKRYHCAGCGGELAAKPDRQHAFAVDVVLDPHAPFQVELTVPMYRCTACEKEQLRSPDEIRGHAPEALARAFQAAGIPPG